MYTIQGWTMDVERHLRPLRAQIFNLDISFSGDRFAMFTGQI